MTSRARRLSVRCVAVVSLAMGAQLGAAGPAGQSARDEVKEKAELEQRIDEAKKELVGLEGRIAQLESDQKRERDLPDKPGAPVTLRGRQTAEEVVVQVSRVPHVLEGEYVVPHGHALHLRAGAEIRCERGAELSVAGTLVVESTPDHPVVMKGKQSRPGYWKGVVLTESATAELDCLHVYDAGVGLLVRRCRLDLTRSVLAGNQVGLRAEGRQARPRLRQCVVSYNTEDGISLVEIGAVRLDRCTVSYNRGWGIYGNYYPSPRLAASVVVRNAKGGIHLSGYESHASASGCVITDNGKWAVYNTCTTELDFRGNYWGERQTRWLQKHGTPADFPTVFDGHDERAAGKVRMADFLTEPPDPCGARLQRLRGKRLVPADLQKGRLSRPPSLEQLREMKKALRTRIEALEGQATPPESPDGAKRGRVKP